MVRRILTHLDLPTEPPPVTPAPLIVDDGVDMDVDGDDLTPGPEVNDAGHRVAVAGEGSGPSRMIAPALTSSLITALDTRTR